MVLYDVMASLAVTGVRRVIVLNGHGGNDDLIRQAVRDVCLTHPVTAGAASYWTVGGAEVAALAARHGDLPVPGHAGGFETSLMCAIRPELVTDSPSRGSMARSTVAPGFYVEAHRWIDQIGGVSDPAAAATGEAGDEYLEVIISKLASGIRDVAVSAGPQINQGESSMVVT